MKDQKLHEKIEYELFMRDDRATAHEAIRVSSQRRKKRKLLTALVGHVFSLFV